jgi:hypothetical protein
MEGLRVKYGKTLDDVLGEFSELLRIGFRGKHTPESFKIALLSVLCELAATTTPSIMREGLEKAIDANKLDSPAYVRAIIEGLSKQAAEADPNHFQPLSGPDRETIEAKFGEYAARWHEYRHCKPKAARQGNVIMPGWFDDPQQSYEFALSYFGRMANEDKQMLNNIIRAIRNMKSE